MESPRGKTASRAGRLAKRSGDVQQCRSSFYARQSGISDWTVDDF
jgi:hypothetical protein